VAPLAPPLLEAADSQTGDPEPELLEGGGVLDVDLPRLLDRRLRAERAPRDR
jgi:hypothetical protein